MTLDAYASLGQFKLFLKVQDDESDTDDLMELSLEAASRAIDKAAGRDFRPAGAASARVFTPQATYIPGSLWYATQWPAVSWISRYEVPIDDTFDSTVSVNFDSTGNGDYDDAETGFRLAPANNPDKGKPYTRIVFDRGVYPSMYPESVEVTAEWGWDETPNTIVNACLLQASRFWHRIDAPFGVAGSPDLGNELRLLDRLDVDVSLMVRPFKKIWGAV